MPKQWNLAKAELDRRLESFMGAETKIPDKENVCGALIHVGFEGNAKCANPKPCHLHNEDGSGKRPGDGTRGEMK